MRIGVISDTHGVVPAWEKALRLFEGCGLVLHAGDVLYHPPRIQDLAGYRLADFAAALNDSPISVVIARGNCDSEVYEELLKMPVQAPYALAEVEGVRIVVNHGHLLDRAGMILAAKRYGAHVFVSGHTHMPALEKVEGVVLLNPGSAAVPKFEKDGKPTPRVAILEDDNIRIVSLDNGEALFEMGDWRVRIHSW